MNVTEQHIQDAIEKAAYLRGFLDGMCCVLTADTTALKLQRELKAAKERLMVCTLDRAFWGEDAGNSSDG